ncbi:LOW QUALITY PROTEIN: hypothetical protein KUTeg_023878 [Tegillarca granosa]|uniref:Glucose-6-phosphate 1-dehydrogenase n=1 Tax=Tegillarca granosa TaxID=220873 RepID=A0ABQ9E926_TEGGR|nr:LOW QUALITY PROTEIN: hypothetical protein KUTeg_023878 [Tegillarca granosa]
MSVISNNDDSDPDSIMFQTDNRHYVVYFASGTVIHSDFSAVESDEGQLALSDILKERITCTKSDKNCVGLKNEFVKNVRYLSLKTSEDFENLSIILDSLNSNETKAWRKGRIFYLAIPPSAYTKTVENLHKCCYQGDEYSWSRVALEKPFGSDKESANNLVHGVAKYFREEEIYLVDHYLAKSVVKQILPFRFSNKDKLEQLLRHQYVDRVEIVMKETIGVKGRIDFYDQYGVVRDVMQNHLTELLALVTMELPRNISNHNSVENNRLHTLKHKSILTGQYSKYLEHAKAEKDNVTSSYFTPTFGATLILVDSYRWKNVPFILVSGKHLDERSSYIRIVFKDREICLSGCNTKRNTTHFFGPKQIIFQIGHGNLPSAGILVSKGLLIPKWPKGITELAITAEDFNEYGQNLNDFTFGIPVKNIEAYSTVIDDMYNGEQKSFVGTKRLLKLWDIWSPIIKETNAKLPRLYKEEKDPMLNFRIVNSGLEFISNPVNIFSDSGSEKYQSRVATSIPGMFLVSLSIDELFRESANTFEKISLAAFEQRGVVNVAFSGGRTPSDFLIHVVRS